MPGKESPCLPPVSCKMELYPPRHCRIYEKAHCPGAPPCLPQRLLRRLPDRGSRCSERNCPPRLSRCRSGFPHRNTRSLSKGGQLFKMRTDFPNPPAHQPQRATDPLHTAHGHHTCQRNCHSPPSTGHSPHSLGQICPLMSKACRSIRTGMLIY